MHPGMLSMVQASAIKETQPQHMHVFQGWITNPVIFPVTRALSPMVQLENPLRKLNWGDPRSDCCMCQPVQGLVQFIICISLHILVIIVAWSVLPQAPCPVLQPSPVQPSLTCHRCGPCAHQQELQPIRQLPITPTRPTTLMVTLWCWCLVKKKFLL